MIYSLEFNTANFTLLIYNIIFRLLQHLLGIEFKQQCCKEMTLSEILGKSSNLRGEDWRGCSKSEYQLPRSSSSQAGTHCDQRADGLLEDPVQLGHVVSNLWAEEAISENPDHDKFKNIKVISWIHSSLSYCSRKFSCSNWQSSKVADWSV